MMSTPSWLRWAADAAVTFGPLSFDAFIHGWKSVWLRDPDGRLVQVTQGFRDEPCPPSLSPA